jgi:hypothetical protein
MPLSVASFSRMVAPTVGGALLAILAGAPSLVATGCGPSLRRVQQADEYFERCYAADRDERRTDDERRACWVAWNEHYRVGQAEDRIDYVRERLVMLDPRQASAIELTTGQEELDPGIEPAPEASPPEGAEVTDTLHGDGPVRARRRPVAPRTRTSACAASCEPDFVACGNACEIADRGCTDACRHRFRQCARGCF